MMVNNIQEIFNPTPKQLQKQIAEHKRIHYDLAVDKGCVTCKHCIHVRDYPGFTIGEECECDIGLECDTILGKITNCKHWEDGWNKDLDNINVPLIYLIDELEKLRIDIDAECQYNDPYGILRDKYLRANEMLNDCIKIIREVGKSNGVISEEYREATDERYLPL